MTGIGRRTLAAGTPITGLASGAGTVARAESTRHARSRAVASARLSTRHARSRAVALALVGALLVNAAAPSAAQAHGPLAPVATSYLARVGRVPAGLGAKVIDGYLRLWLRVPAQEDVVVLDYRGAPYLRFARAGVYVNRSSEMYYLNHYPVLTPPAGLSRATPARWERVSAGHEYNWHDGRIGALADSALAPATGYVGRWSISLLLDGRLGSISGGFWRGSTPSPMWFWPIAVLLACLLAALRLRRRELDARLAHGLAIAALVAVAVGTVGRALHGRPTIGVDQFVLLGVVLLAVALALVRVLRRREGRILLFVIAYGALQMGAELAPTLLHGFVLIALPAFLARAAASLCLACGAGLLLLVLRMAALIP
ncbi:MAG TPA: hypothetical protein VMU32_05300 [Solirubrobacteraceae bacterium]|nr:hypothetical protein [Solirubrobacteraceae bacterium]